MSQVGTFLAYANDGLWMWIDGELFLPRHWFTRGMTKERKRLCIPPDRKFATKIEPGWQMIERVRDEGLPFEVVCCDTLYGRSYWRRRKMSGAGLVYYADTIIGVAPSEFFGTTVGQAPDLWAPLAMGAQMPPMHWDGRNDPLFQSLNLIARLKPGVSAEQASAVVNLQFKQFLQETAGPDGFRRS